MTLSIEEYIEARLVHEIHTSERRSFRNCRRRWDWIFRQMYYPKVNAKPLEFGSAYHVAMEVFYDPETWTWDHEVKVASAISAFVNTCNEQRDAYLKIKDEQYITSEEIETDYDERLVLGVGMLKYHLGILSPLIDKGFKPIRVEQEFIAPINNPDTGEFMYCKCDRCWMLWEAELAKPWDDTTSHPLENMKQQHPDYRAKYWEGLPVVLAGRVDLLAQDMHGDLWIVDWKTARSISTDDEFLYLDDQISSYVMAFRRKLGLNVRGFIYHEQRKAFPEPPKRNKTMRLGRMYSVNQNIACTPELYRATVAEHDEEAFKAGLYDDFLAFLENESPFWKRFQIFRSDIELENIERMLWLEASDMIDQDLRIYPNAGRFNCGFCAFRQPCLEQTAGEDYRFLLDTVYDKREVHYWVKEKKPLSTDSQGGE